MEPALAPAEHKLLHPEQPLRWEPVGKGAYALSKFHVENQGENNLPNSSGLWKKTATGITSREPHKTGVFSHVPIVDDEGYSIEKEVPNLQPGLVAYKEHLQHWTPVFDRMTTQATRGALAAEKMARAYSEAVIRNNLSR
jgi:hypothetical protein